MAIAKSAGTATTGLRLHHRPLPAASSVTSAMASSAALNGTRSCVAIDRASAVMADVTPATQTTGARPRLQASAVAATTNETSTEAVTVVDSTLKTRVSSHSMGARINAAVAAYDVLAN